VISVLVSGQLTSTPEFKLTRQRGLRAADRREGQTPDLARGSLAQQALRHVQARRKLLQRHPADRRTGGREAVGLRSTARATSLLL